MIPRCVLFDNSQSVQLHGFCNASQSAFGACIYVQSAITGERHLYCAKSRGTPLKASTIPRLELCGALLLAELISVVSRELSCLGIVCNSKNVTLWSNFTIVIAWINSYKQLKPYVSNRIAQILDLTKPDQWRHVPTNWNPADIISRGCPAEALSENELWWQGPNWLSQDESHWPSIKTVLLQELPEKHEIRSILVVN